MTGWQVPTAAANAITVHSKQLVYTGRAALETFVKDSYVRLAEALSTADRTPGPTPAGLAGHDVHFYRSEEALTSSVVDFLAAGIRVGQPVIVIATPDHRRRFVEGLRERISILRSSSPAGLLCGS